MIERYRFDSIAKIWTEQHKYALWLKIELLFLKNLTGGDYKVSLSEVDIEEIKVIEERTQHDVAAFVEWLEMRTNNRIHYGLTSSDILDTTLSLQIQETNKIITDLLIQAVEQISLLKKSAKDLSLLGRTHGQAAEKISFAYKCDQWSRILSWLLQHTFNYYGKLSGSVGDTKYFDSQIAARTLQELDLEDGTPVTQGQIISRTVYASYLQWWALVISSVEKITTDIRLLSQTGIDEVHEGRSSTQVGSSSMPHKRNPIACENLSGIARVIRGYSLTALENIPLWAERDISHSSAERIIFPDAAELLGYALSRFIKILSELQLNEANMKKNILAVKESQAAMLDLIAGGMSRKDAHQQLRVIS